MAWMSAVSLVMSKGGSNAADLTADLNQRDGIVGGDVVSQVLADGHVGVAGEAASDVNGGIGVLCDDDRRVEVTLGVEAVAGCGGDVGHVVGRDGA